MSAVAVATALNWQTVCGSARGASHERSSLPNQDCGAAATLGYGEGAIIAVADGHGDELHGRSDRGSRFAVDVATAALRSWIGSADGNEDKMRATAARLPETILRAWHEKVLADLERDPPREAETNLRRADKAEIIRRSPEVLYGSTLVAAAINERVAAYLQIGDGDLLAVGADDKVRRLIPGRDDLMINQTESLCQSDAQARFRVEVDVLDAGKRPALVLAATDGYCNSYAGDDAAFFKVATDLRDYLDRRGPAWVERHIGNWLKQTSETGSGDDITVALAWHGSAVAEPPASRGRRLLRGLRTRGRPVLRALLVLVVIAAIGTSALWLARNQVPPAWKEHAIEWVQKAVQKAKDVLRIGPRGGGAPAAVSALTIPFGGVW